MSRVDEGADGRRQVDMALELAPVMARVLLEIEWTAEDVNDARGISFCPSCGACNDPDCTEHYDGGYNCGHEEDDPEHDHEDPDCHPCGSGHAEGCKLAAVIAKIKEIWPGIEKEIWPGMAVGTQAKAKPE